MLERSDRTQTFLDEYKRLESALRLSDRGAPTVLDYENTLTGDEADKLRLCRIVRNFLQHHENAGSFIQPTDEMTAFVRFETMFVRAKIDKAADLAYKLKPVKFSMTLREVMSMFLRKQTADMTWLPVVDDSGRFVGVLTWRALMQLMKRMDIDKADIFMVKFGEWKKSLDGISVIDADAIPTELVRSGEKAVVVKKDKYVGILNCQNV